MGTKVAARYVLTVPSGGQHIIRCRLSALEHRVHPPFGKKVFDDVVTRTKLEADEFYKAVIPGERALSKFVKFLHSRERRYKTDPQLSEEI